MLTFLNALLGVATLALAGSLGYALALSGNFRMGFIAHLPDRLRGPLSVVFTSLWFIVALLGLGGVGRLTYARWGPEGDTATAFTAAVTALSIFTCWNVIKACLKLRKAGV